MLWDSHLENYTSNVFSQFKEAKRVTSEKLKLSGI